MNIVLLSLILFLSTHAFARQSIALSPINFEISAAHALSKFDQVVQNPEDILRRFRPVGVKIINKRVSQNQISFTAIKTVLVISKSVYVHGILESSEVSRGCSEDRKGYALKMRFDSSDQLVTDNVDELRALICLREESNSKISGQIRSQIITGNRYSRTIGPLAVNLIKDQVNPLLSALTEEIKSMR
jgi:hypothetical protein